MAGAEIETQLESPEPPRDDLERQLTKLVEEENDKQDEGMQKQAATDEKVDDKPDSPCFAYSRDETWEKGHWSSQTWSDWSWDRYDSSTGPWSRSWTRHSWSQEDWCKEIQRGPSADLSAEFEESYNKNGDEQEHAKAASQRQSTSWEDQTRPVAPSPSEDKAEPKQSDTTLEQQLPLTSVSYNAEPDQQENPKSKVTSEQQGTTPMETSDAQPDQQENPKSNVTSEQQGTTPMETDKAQPDQQKNPKSKVTSEQQGTTPMETDKAQPDQQENPKSKVTSEQQGTTPMETSGAQPDQQENPKSKVTSEQQGTTPKEIKDSAEVSKVPAPNQQEPTVKEEPEAMGRTEDQWRCDKKGRLLKPHALYMRFYRSVRRFSSALITFIIYYIYIYVIINYICLRVYV